MMDHAHESQVRSLTPEAFLELGGPNLVYIRAVPTSGGTAWGIFAQNGQPMGVVDGPSSVLVPEDESGAGLWLKRVWKSFY